MMTSKLYWQLYDACVKAMAKKMRVTEYQIHERAMLRTTPANIHDPHKRLGLIWKEWKVGRRVPAMLLH